MSQFRAAEEHGPLRELFPGLHFVTGAFRMGPGVSITRNMFVVEQGEGLVVVSSMRLSPEGERELDALGEVKHVVRIGAFHGADDAYYLDRYRAQHWAPARTPGAEGAKVLSPGGGPIAHAKVFLFEKGKHGEAAILLERDGGVLLTADSYQNWTSFADCSLLGGLVGRVMGFGPAMIGGPWVKAQGPAVREDFARLRELDFRHLLPGHGAPLLDDAKVALDSAIANRFGTS